MKINTVTIHNFRSVEDATFNLHDYGLLVGANNAGKSNIADALRVFYEADGYRWKKDRDFPKFETQDQESWVEIEYKLTDQEYASLAEQYQLGDNCLRVRKYLVPPDTHKASIYGYTAEGLSDGYFYGAKGVQQGKLGEVIYVPAVSRIDEVTKLSGPSALRNLLYNLIDKLTATSPSFQRLTDNFEQFSADFKGEATEDNYSIETLEQDINEGIAEWEMEFSLNINPISPRDVIKNLVDLDVTDYSYGGTLDPDQFGHGFQRHLIFTLLNLAAKYQAAPAKPTDKKEFTPNLTLVLFEEPEAYLHPTQQTVLFNSLKDLAEEPGTQVLITTHSPLFVSYNSGELRSVIRLRREEGRTTVGQLTPAILNRIFQENREINELLDESWYDNIKPDEADLDDAIEAIRYFLYLDPERCGLFFAQQVLLVEGLTERHLINFLLRNGYIDAPSGGVYVLDCMSKFNIHRYLNLLGELKITHSVLFDEDHGAFHERINALIKQSRNRYTMGMAAFPCDLEDYLDVEKPTKGKNKPERLMLKLAKGEIPQDRLKALVRLINGLVNPE